MDLRAGEPPPPSQCLPRPVSEAGVRVSRLHLPKAEVLGQKRGGRAQRHHGAGLTKVSTVLLFYVENIQISHRLKKSEV